MILLRLFYEFFLTGAFAVGGGMAAIPFLYNMADKTGWFSYGQLADMIAISESTPGPIGVNMATYVGFMTAGIPGAVTATIGLILPSVVIILLVARVLKAFRQNPAVDAAFYGLRPCSVALISAAGLLVVQIAFFGSGLSISGLLIHWKELLLAALLLVLTRTVKKTKKLHPVYFIALSAVIGALFSF